MSGTNFTNTKATKQKTRVVNQTGQVFISASILSHQLCFFGGSDAPAAAVSISVFISSADCCRFSRSACMALRTILSMSAPTGVFSLGRGEK